MRKVTYIISDIDKALAFEWVAKYLPCKEISLSFILLNPGASYLESFLLQSKLPVYRVRCRGKLDWPHALIATWRLLRNLQPDVVHCHLIQANIIGLTAAYLAGISHRVYTRHHSSLHHVYFKKGVVWDKLTNRLATRIIAISGVVQQVLCEMEGVQPHKISVILHGFDLTFFAAPSAERVQAFRKRASLNGQETVVGVVSRFTEWKGVQYIIPAFAAFLQLFPTALLLLINAKGDYEKQLVEQLEATLPAHAYRFLSFENDIAAAYHSMNMFIHVPVDAHSEAFGQVYVESLAAGTPAIFTKSGIANSPAFNDQVASIVEFQNSEAIFKEMKTIMNNSSAINKRIEAGQKLASGFNLQNYILNLKQAYKLN